MNKNDALPVRFEMRASEKWIAAVDDWRRMQPDIPSRAEAIRRLVTQSVGGKGVRQETGDN